MQLKLYHKVYLLLLCCNIILGNVHGPPETSRKTKNDKNDETINKEKEFVASIEDVDDVSPIEIVPSPDLTKERKPNKGM